MYSLYYRAWFGGERSYPRPETLSPPDCVVRAGSEGEYYFPAHRAVLAAHSDYLKASLADQVNSAARNHHEAATAGHVVVTVSVPSDIGVEAFVPLLKYMYTGRLEVGPDNIYTVLPATYRLQMPGALEQCRAALLELCATPAAVAAAAAAFVSSPVVVNGTTSGVTSSSSSSSVLRPVPNRLLAPPPPIYWPEGTSLYPVPPPPPRHLELPHLPALQVAPAAAVGSLPPSLAAHSSASFGSKERSVSPASRRESESSSPELVVASSPVPIEEQQTRQPSPPASGSSERVSVGDEDRRQQSQARRRRLHQQQRTGCRRSSSGRSEKTVQENATSAAQSTGVVFDVAWCDGPVRFERVRNENYAPCGVQGSPNRPHTKQQFANRPSYPSSELSSSPSSTPNRHTIENDENAQSSPLTAANNMNQSTVTPNGRSYTCTHCQHTFKSQYCYRKHARRHLLQPSSHSSESSLQQQRSADNKVARHLDPNVQYYPCKICGNKFPSYYFVHKHRMLKHANVDKQQGKADATRVGVNKSETGQQVDKVEQQQA